MINATIKTQAALQSLLDKGYTLSIRCEGELLQKRTDDLNAVMAILSDVEEADVRVWQGPLGQTPERVGFIYCALDTDGVNIVDHTHALPL